MQVEVNASESAVHDLYSAYKKQGGTMTTIGEFAKATAQEIIDRYYHPEYFDVSELKQSYDG